MSPENEIRLEILRSAPLDTWLALSQDEMRLVAVGASFKEAVERADEAGESDPVILKTPPSWGPLSV